jgi:hypothetical protein
MSEILTQSYLVLAVGYPLFLSDFNKAGIFSTIFEKCSNVKFHGNVYSESRLCPGRGVDERTFSGHTDMKKKLTVAIHYFATRPKQLKAKGRMHVFN